MIPQRTTSIRNPSQSPQWAEDCRGSAAIELAVLIAIVVFCVIAVFRQTSSASSGSFLSVNQVLAAKRSGVPTASSPVVESQLKATPFVVSRALTLFNICLLFVAIGGWLIERRIRIRLAAAMTSNSPASSIRGTTDPTNESRCRFSEKRLRILNTLINDNHKLLPSDMKVGDLMTTDLKTALPKSTVSELRTLFADKAFRHVLICDETQHLVGVVSDRDLRHVNESAVAETLMSARPTTVTSECCVNDAITKLLYGRISSLPVVDDGRLVGIITTTDVVMTLQCTMLAVEQIVTNLRADRKNKECESLV